jgi:hypothetical protein
MRRSDLSVLSVERAVIDDILLKKIFFFNFIFGAATIIVIYDNDFTLIIDIYFYETFSTLNSNQ